MFSVDTSICKAEPPPSTKTSPSSPSDWLKAGRCSHVRPECSRYVQKPAVFSMGKMAGSNSLLSDNSVAISSGIFRLGGLNSYYAIPRSL